MESFEKTGNSDDRAFIIFRTKTSKTNAQVFSNEAAQRLISFSSLISETVAASSDIVSLCLYSGWAELFEKRLEERKREGGEDTGTALIDMIMSGNRRYLVKAACATACDTLKEKQYIFVIERFSNDKLNFPFISRKWQLTHREQEIVRLFIDGRCNKEIADTLNLSINTVKSYVKGLSLKLGVSGRAEIVSRFISEIHD